MSQTQKKYTLSSKDKPSSNLPTEYYQNIQGSWRKEPIPAHQRQISNKRGSLKPVQIRSNDYVEVPSDLNHTKTAVNTSSHLTDTINTSMKRQIVYERVDESSAPSKQQWSGNPSIPMVKVEDHDDMAAELPQHDDFVKIQQLQDQYQSIDVQSPRFAQSQDGEPSLEGDISHLNESCSDSDLFVGPQSIDLFLPVHTIKLFLNQTTQDKKERRQRAQDMLTRRRREMNLKLETDEPSGDSIEFQKTIPHDPVKRDEQQTQYPMSVTGVILDDLHQLLDQESYASTNQANIVLAIDKNTKGSEGISSVFETEPHVYAQIQGPNQSEHLTLQGRSLEPQVNHSIGHDGGLVVKKLDSELVVQTDNSKERLIQQLGETIRTYDAEVEGRFELPKEQLQSILFQSSISISDHYKESAKVNSSTFKTRGQQSNGISSIPKQKSPRQSLKPQTKVNVSMSKNKSLIKKINSVKSPFTASQKQSQSSPKTVKTPQERKVGGASTQNLKQSPRQQQHSLSNQRNSTIRGSRLLENKVKKSTDNKNAIIPVKPLKKEESNQHPLAQANQKVAPQEKPKTQSVSNQNDTKQSQNRLTSKKPLTDELKPVQKTRTRPSRVVSESRVSKDSVATLQAKSPLARRQNNLEPQKQKTEQASNLRKGREKQKPPNAAPLRRFKTQIRDETEQQPVEAPQSYSIQLSSFQDRNLKTKLSQNEDFGRMSYDDLSVVESQGVKEVVESPKRDLQQQPQKDKQTREDFNTCVIDIDNNRGIVVEKNDVDKNTVDTPELERPELDSQQSPMQAKDGYSSLSPVIQRSSGKKKENIEAKYFSSNDSFIIAQSKISSPVQTESMITISRKGAKVNDLKQSTYGLSQRSKKQDNDQASPGPRHENSLTKKSENSMYKFKIQLEEAHLLRKVNNLRGRDKKKIRVNNMPNHGIPVKNQKNRLKSIFAESDFNDGVSMNKRKNTSTLRVTKNVKKSQGSVASAVSSKASPPKSIPSKLSPQKFKKFVEGSPLTTLQTSRKIKAPLLFQPTTISKQNTQTQKTPKSWLIESRMNLTDGSIEEEIKEKTPIERQIQTQLSPRKKIDISNLNKNPYLKQNRSRALSKMYQKQLIEKRERKTAQNIVHNLNRQRELSQKVDQSQLLVQDDNSNVQQVLAISVDRELSVPDNTPKAHQNSCAYQFSKIDQSESAKVINNAARLAETIKRIHDEFYQHSTPRRQRKAQQQSRRHQKILIEQHGTYTQKTPTDKSQGKHHKDISVFNSQFSDNSHTFQQSSLAIQYNIINEDQGRCDKQQVDDYMAERGDQKVTSCDESSMQDQSQKHHASKIDINRATPHSFQKKRLLSDGKSGTYEQQSVLKPRKLFKLQKPVLMKQWQQVNETMYNLVQINNSQHHFVPLGKPSTSLCQTMPSSQYHTHQQSPTFGSDDVNDSQKELDRLKMANQYQQCSYNEIQSRIDYRKMQQQRVFKYKKRSTEIENLRVQQQIDEERVQKLALQSITSQRKGKEQTSHSTQQQLKIISRDDPQNVLGYSKLKSSLPSTSRSLRSHQIGSGEFTPILTEKTRAAQKNSPPKASNLQITETMQKNINGMLKSVNRVKTLQMADQALSQTRQKSQKTNRRESFVSPIRSIKDSDVTATSQPYSFQHTSKHQRSNGQEMNMPSNSRAKFLPTSNQFGMHQTNRPTLDLSVQEGLMKLSSSIRHHKLNGNATTHTSMTFADPQDPNQSRTLLDHFQLQTQQNEDAFALHRSHYLEKRKPVPNGNAKSRESVGQHSQLSNIGLSILQTNQHTSSQLKQK